MLAVFFLFSPACPLLRILIAPICCELFLLAFPVSNIRLVVDAFEISRSCGARTAAFDEEEADKKKEGEGVAVRDLDEGRDKKLKVGLCLTSLRLLPDVLTMCRPRPPSRSST